MSVIKCTNKMYVEEKTGKYRMAQRKMTHKLKDEHYAHCDLCLLMPSVPIFAYYKYISDMTHFF